MLTNNERKYFLSSLGRLKKNIEILEDELRGKIEPEEKETGFTNDYFDKVYSTGSFKKPAGLKNKKAVR
jgi:hypothetical protein